MKKDHRIALDRRDFLKLVAAAGLGSMLPGGGWADDAGAPSDTPTMPLRDFGRTGVKVPILSLGGMFDIPNNHMVLRRALQLGVTYWDTAASYEGGRSETGIGAFFENEPEARKKVFLVTKSGARDPAGMTRLLNQSLERMKTDWIDLYFVHGVKNINEIGDHTKQWAERAKREKKIRFIGFSTHSNMQECMEEAAKLGWIDGLMIKYDFRLMREDRMKRAVEACEKAGIGLTAMKTQGGGPIPADADAEKELAAAFVARGFTAGQAKLKAVWSEPRIAAICSQMPNLRLLNENAAAAMDRVRLTHAEEAALQRYAARTACGYCAGCARLCESAAGGLPVADLMRVLMYERSYSSPTLARAEFRQLSDQITRLFDPRSLAAAESVCPQHLPLARLAAEAFRMWGRDAIA